MTGATGNVGRPLVEALIEAGEKVTAVSRRSVPRVDLTEPETLAPVLDGADALFLLTSGDFIAAGGDVGKVLDVVRAAGVRRVVMLSSQGVATGSHPSTLEDPLTGSDLNWTLLRPGGFHSNTFAWAESVRTRREVAAPFGDVALPTIDPLDIAEVAAVTLRGDGHTGRAYVLTGPAPITPRQQVAAIAAALGEPVRFVEQSREEAAARMREFMPAPVVASTLDILGTPKPAEQQAGPAVEQLLGRAPHSFAAWAARNVAAFA
ncbi:NAD(P)H-binding protein [Actinoplanes sichuanensis]|nr:NAD(P)H-binding protein [Actinoplanes sichuanensis]